MNHRFSRVFLNLVNIICFNMLRGCKACSNPFDHIIRALFYEFFTLYFRFFSEGKSNRSYDGINTKGEHMCALRGYKQQEKQLKQGDGYQGRSEEHTSELQSRFDLVCRLLLDKKTS